MGILTNSAMWRKSFRLLVWGWSWFKWKDHYQTLV